MADCFLSGKAGNGARRHASNAETRPALASSGARTDDGSRPRAAIVAVIVALGIALGACGSGPTHEPVTRASFIRVADARCMSDNAAAVSVDLTNTAKTAAMLKQTIAARTRLERDLKALPAPPGDNAALTAFFESYDRHLAALKDMQAAAVQGNNELTAQLARTQAQRMQEMETSAAAYGFSFCGRF